MSYHATYDAINAWESLDKRERARTLAATYFAPVKWSGYDHNGFEKRDDIYKQSGVEALACATGLNEYCNHWHKFTQSLPETHTRSIQATLASRLLINLTGSVLESAGIALEHACGIPIIPGSAVKGAVRRAAIASMLECTEEKKLELMMDFLAIFGYSQIDLEPDSDLARVLGSDALRELCQGYSDRKGQVCFLQSVPIEPVNICEEVLTPHHSQYMAGNINEPTDDETPTPIFFPAVECDGKGAYNFVLYAPKHPELLDKAEEWLTLAIILFGIGAKTSSGYGYFTLRDKDLQNFTTEQEKCIKDISENADLRNLFIKFHKDKDKTPIKHWALLFVISLSENAPACRAKDYRDFLNHIKSLEEQLRNETSSGSKKELKLRIKNCYKSLEAMKQMAQEYNLNLPNFS